MTAAEAFVYIIIAVIIGQGLCYMGANIGEGLKEIAKSINKEK
mgnify:CR=1 FL=1